MDCINASWKDRSLTDQEIRIITTRWRKLGLLRDLYVSQRMSTEYEAFRIRFASSLSNETRASLVQPGVTSSDASSPPSRSTSINHSNLKARFYRSLCLHSIAISSLRLGLSCQDQTRNESHPQNAVGNQIAEATALAWDNSVITLGGRQVIPGHYDKVCCLEIVDFVYLFILRKVIPFDKLDSWTMQDVEYWPYDRDDGSGVLEDQVTSWYSFLDFSRRTLLPWDIVDLISNNS